MFTIEHQDDLNLSGEVFTDYEILVTGQFSFSDPTSDFTILWLRLKNPCLDPAFVNLFKANDLTDQEYTITQTEVRYQVPAFTVKPSTCTLIYSFEISEEKGRKAVQFDAETRTFIFYLVGDIELAGGTYTDYDIKYVG